MRKFKKLDWNEENLESLSNGDLKKLGDYWLRKYLLNKTEKINNKVYCPLKKKWFIEDQIHCCHFFDRSVIHLRFDLRNVHLISSISNTFDSQIQVEGYKSKHHKEYEEYLINKIGVKNIDEMLQIKNNLTIFVKEDYIKVIKQFRYGD